METEKINCTGFLSIPKMDHKNSFSRDGSVETLHIASGIANYGSFVWKQAPKIGFEFDHPPHSARDCRPSV